MTFEEGCRTVRLSNEFASVAITLDTSANGMRALIENTRDGRHIYLDPLELASLTWVRHDELAMFLDPSQTGWRGDGSLIGED